MDGRCRILYDNNQNEMIINIISTEQVIHKMQHKEFYMKESNHDIYNKTQIKTIKLDQIEFRRHDEKRSNNHQIKTL